jgi:Rrf2 family protein
MKFSRESLYGLQALSYLATCPRDTVLQADELARRTKLPKVFLAKILYTLARQGVLRSYRGRLRGYTLARDPRDITVREIIEIFDGGDIFERCVFWSSQCSNRRPCPLHGLWRSVRPAVAARIERVSLEDVASRKSLPFNLPSVSRSRACAARKRRVGTVAS